MRQHNIWCVYVRSVWRGMLDCSPVTLIVPNIPEHCQCSIIIVTILLYLSRGAMIIYFCGLTGFALFLILNSRCRICSPIN